MRAVRSGCDEIHIDVMDGRFVQNFGLGAPIASAVSELTKRPIEVHMMTVEPALSVQLFAAAGIDMFTVHAEAESSVDALKCAVKAGMKPAVAILPTTPLPKLLNFTDIAQRVLIMAAEPGFSGQNFIPETLNRIRQIAEMLEEARRGDIEIAVDGGVSGSNAVGIVEAGARVLVSGSYLFRARNMQQAVLSLRSCLHL